jgi:hypothetical protein
MTLRDVRWPHQDMTDKSDNEVVWDWFHVSLQAYKLRHIEIEPNVNLHSLEYLQ